MRRSPSHIPTSGTKQPNSQVGAVELEILWMCMLSVNLSGKGWGKELRSKAQMLSKAGSGTSVQPNEDVSYVESSPPAIWTISKA